MDAPERKGTVVSTRVILPALSIGLYLSWWGLCHDEMLYIAFSIEMVQSCMSSFAGVLAAGAILSATWNRQWWRSGRFFAGVVGCQLVVFACFGGSLLVELTPAIIACEPFVSITVFFALFMVVRSVADASLSELVGILSGSLVAYGCVVGMFWAITTMAPGSLARVALYGCVCVAAAICTYAALRRFRFMRADAKCGSKEKDSELVRPLDSECIHVPFPLAVHVVSYALVFGFTHSLSGRVVPSVPEKVFPSFIGMIIAGILFQMVFGKITKEGRIWPKVRGAILPLTMFSFLLLPFASEGMVALSVAVAECAFDTYFAFFTLAVFVVARKIDCDVLRVLARGIVLGIPALIAGLGIIQVASKVIPSMNMMLNVFAVIVFGLLVAGTFWVGDDKRVSFVWGLERKLTPRSYEDEQIAVRCQKAAQQFGLTERERQILVHLAHGESGATIAESEVISLYTVRTHVSRIHRKMDVHTQKELMCKLKSL